MSILLFILHAPDTILGNLFLSFWYGKSVHRKWFILIGAFANRRMPLLQYQFERFPFIFPTQKNLFRFCHPKTHPIPVVDTHKIHNVKCERTKTTGFWQVTRNMGDEKCNLQFPNCRTVQPKLSVRLNSILVVGATFATKWTNIFNSFVMFRAFLSNRWVPTTTFTTCCYLFHWLERTKWNSATELNEIQREYWLASQ